MLTTRRKFKHKLWIVLPVLIALTGCSLLPAEEDTLKPPLIKPPQENYRTVEVVKGEVTQEVRGNGTFESYESETLMFNTAGGRVQEVLVKAGDKVQKGDLLVQLDVESMDIELKQLELNMLRARQGLRNAKLSEDAEALQIAQIQYDIENMKYERLLEAYNTKQLVSSIDGQVTFVDDLKEGDYVEVYRPIVMISDPSKLRFVFQPDSTADIHSIGVGFKVHLKVGSTDLEGAVAQTPSSAPFTENEVLRSRYQRYIYVDVDNIPEGTTIGLRGDVRILLQERQEVLLIPRSGLRSYLGRTFVRILEEGDKIREVDVETGITGSTSVEISKGLQEGDLVVLP